MIDFIKYILRYWTHYRPIEIKKDSNMIEKDKWICVNFWIKYSKSGISIADVVLNGVTKDFNDGQWHYIVEDKEFIYCDQWKKKRTN